MTSDPDPDQRPRIETRRDISKQTDRPNASFGALVYGGRSGLDGSLVAMLRLLITKSDSSCIRLLQVVYRLELRLRHLLLWWHVGAARLGCSFGRHRGKMSSDHYSSRTVSTIAPLTSRVNDLFLAGLPSIRWTHWVLGRRARWRFRCRPRCYGSMFLRRRVHLEQSHGVLRGDRDE